MNLLESLKEELWEIENLEPFSLVFYGSRSRREEDVFSDYNFFLLASSSDILRSDFKRQLLDLLSLHFSENVINLSFNDFESFQMRINLFEPTACHIMELGEVVFGNESFSELQAFWNIKKKEPLQVEPLVAYLQKRIHFYNKLKNTKTLADNISRIESIILFRLQILIISLISDLTISEIAFLDIPSRLSKLIQTLYKNDLPSSILSIAPILEQVHEAKRIAQVFEKGTLEDKTLVIKSIKQVLLNSEAVLEKLFQVV